MLLLRIDVDSATAQAWFEYAGYRIRDAREPLSDVMHDVVWPAIRGQLDSEGARSGDPWVELNEKYREWKDLHYPGRPILVLTGAMERALFDPFAYHVTRDRLVYTPDSDYLGWHQSGGYVEGRPPQRVVLDLIPEDYEEVERIFTRWLYEIAETNTRRTASADYEAPLPHFYIPGI